MSAGVGSRSTAWTLLRQGLSLGILRRPRSPLRFATPGAFLFACALLLALGFAIDSWRVPAPRYLVIVAFAWVALDWMLALVVGWLASRLLARPALWLTIATLLILAQIPLIGLLLAGETALGEHARYWRIVPWIAGLGVLAYAWRLFGFVAREARWPRRVAAWLAVGLLWLAPAYLLPSVDFWYALPRHVPASAPKPAPFDPEAVLSEQPSQVARAVAALRAQTPGRTDLYALGFAGDGAERVFRNEIEYLPRLLGARFGAAGRTLSLINSPDTTGRVPLATLTNLRLALKGLASRMDADEDLLLLLLTSHGSDDHEIYVDLPPLPLNQIDPEALRGALDDSGIRWRIVVVSACYSGGFVEALKDPRTLVITAARADRPSFGCGADSQITWFGKAFLAQALNETTSISEAFQRAKKKIAAWERKDEETPSEPQYVAGALIEAKLRAWQAGLRGGKAVPFTVAKSGTTAKRARREGASMRD